MNYPAIPVNFQWRLLLTLTAFWAHIPARPDGAEAGWRSGSRVPPPWRVRRLDGQPVPMERRDRRGSALSRARPRVIFISTASTEPTGSVR